MTLYELLLSGSRVSPWKLIVMAGLAGISNALVLATINLGIEDLSAEGTKLSLVVRFVLIIGIYALSQRYIMVVTARETENIIHEIRLRLVDKIRRSDLSSIEQVGRSSIYAAVTKETTLITQITPQLVTGVQAAVLVLCVMVYIFLLSRVGFFLAVAVIVLAIAMHLLRAKQLNLEIANSQRLEDSLFDRVTDLLSGFKEVKLSLPRGTALNDHITEVSEETAESKVSMQGRIATEFILSQVAFYLLLATLVFLLPMFSTTPSNVVAKMATAVLFLIGPISLLVQTIPSLALAQSAINRINDLDAVLDQNLGEQSGKQTAAPAEQNASFDGIELKNVRFSYPTQNGEKGFSIGPINLEVQRGETLFLTGGNGSGKSTLLKVLTGLYPVSEGRIYLDGQSIAVSDLDALRSKISAIFTDFHLFRQLYGLEATPKSVFDRWLARFQIQDKVKLAKNAVSTTDLSTGQKKRLAFVISLLEDRPVLVLDEWAADQDPGFREFYYEVLLRELKEQGKTLIVVSHDDRYFHVADRHVHMDEGLLVHPGTHAALSGPNDGARYSRSEGARLIAEDDAP